MGKSFRVTIGLYNRHYHNYSNYDHYNHYNHYNAKEELKDYHHHSLSPWKGGMQPLCNL